MKNLNHPKKMHKTEKHNSLSNLIFSKIYLICARNIGAARHPVYYHQTPKRPMWFWAKKNTQGEDRKRTDLFVNLHIIKQTHQMPSILLILFINKTLSTFFQWVRIPTEFAPPTCSKQNCPQIRLEILEKNEDADGLLGATALLDEFSVGRGQIPRPQNRLPPETLRGGVALGLKESLIRGAHAGPRPPGRAPPPHRRTCHQSVAREWTRTRLLFTTPTPPPGGGSGQRSPTWDRGWPRGGSLVIKKLGYLNTPNIKKPHLVWLCLFTTAF